MEHKTTMVREYINQQAVAADEQKLGLEGWSVQSTVNPNQQQSLLARVRSLFSSKATHLVVTYYRAAAF